MYQNGKNITFTDRSVGSVNNFLGSLSKQKPLTNEEEYDLWSHMCQGSKQARERLICSNLRYVVTVAKEYLASKAPFEDLIMAGCEGIIKAVDKFDATLGFRFISFATWYIESEIRKTAYDYIRHNADSLDDSVYAGVESGATWIDFLPADRHEAPDWSLRYYDTLTSLANRADKRLYGAGKLIVNLHKMLQKGYTTSDFVRKYRLTDRQMGRLLGILREEAGNSLQQSA